MRSTTWVLRVPIIMANLDLFRSFGLGLLLFFGHTAPMAISQSESAIQASPITGSFDFAELTARYSIPSISVHTNYNRALSPRAFKKVPDLPAGWKAVFGTTTALMPVFMSAAQLRMFYQAVARAAIELDDSWRCTIQLGQLVLQLTSRDRRQRIVTRELIVATAMMLNEFAAQGFTELFIARLWDEIGGGVVDIQLRITTRVVDGMKIS
ncbi:MAG: hypothetical protein LQ343_002755 [Gyalolechia ehrenbergii]|nr:MAG: hypothetical protein LQ343_002755 [Gyalolechia ehrenbergii]